MSSRHLFLSYAKEDAESVRRIRARLQKAGLQPWLDEHDLLPGQDWDAAIRSAIRSSEAFVAFLSTRAVDKRGYVQREIHEALEVAERMPEGRAFILPVRLDECVMPDRLRRWHRIDLFKRGGYGRLQAALLSQAGVPKGALGVAVTSPPAFETPADHLLYDLLVGSGRVVYTRPRGRRYTIGQGHFFVLRYDMPEPILKLQRRVADFRRITTENVAGLIKSNAPWRRPENLVVRVAAVPTSRTVVVQSATATTGVDRGYWALAMMLTRQPSVYIMPDKTDLLYIEEKKRMIMIIAPRRLSDEDRTALRSP